MSFWNDEVIKEAEEKTGGFDALPEGNYRVLLTNAEVKETRAGGHYLNAKFELHGNANFDGRILFAKFNVDNANATAVSIGLGQLKEFATAANVPTWYEDLKTATDWASAEAKLNKAFDALGNIPVEVKVVIKKDEKYGDQNDIKRFKAVEGATAAPAPSAKGGAKKAPWEK